ncbi:MAG: PAS domain-containing protein, partial [Rhodospirillaceae bacterium]|nr:PAS domain-containing protein [Rhodospirillaceae bacterium]
MVSPDQKNIVSTLINALPIAVAVVDKDGCLSSGNEAFQNLWHLEKGYLDAQPTFVSFLDRLREQRLLPEQTDFAKFRSGVVKKAQAEKETQDEWHLPDGLSLSIKFVPLGESGALFIIEDLSPELNAKRGFNALNMTHQATLDHLREGLAVFGGDGLLKLHNPAFAEMWQLPKDALSHSFHMTDFLDATRKRLPVLENWPARRTKLSGRLLGRKAGVDQIHCNSGQILEAAHIPLPDGAVLLRYADISDRVKLAETLTARAEEMAERAELMAAADRLKSEFLANLSHEIRTPLTAISGFAELLAGDYFGDLNKRQQEYADGIVSASQAVSGLVGDILDLASVEAGLLELDMASLDLHICLAETMQLVGERARHKKLKLQFDCPLDIGWIEADERRLKQCLLHVLGNAITFSSSGGILQISATRNTSGVKIDISDTGIG